MKGFDDPRANRLLAALPGPEFARIAAYLRPVGLALGEVLYAPGRPLRQVTFPGHCIVSLNYVMHNGASSEIAGVGNEGVVGIPLFMGDGTTPGSAVVQTAGSAFCLDRAVLRREFERRGEMQRLLLLYTQAFIAQTTQTAACNRYHSVDQQLSRWLMLTLDRIPDGELVMTQELIASMLGVRREGITEAAGRLQASGCIRYRRGHITVIDRVRLAGKTCECYAVVKTEVARLLPPRTAEEAVFSRTAFQADPP